MDRNEHIGYNTALPVPRALRCPETHAALHRRPDADKLAFSVFGLRGYYLVLSAD
jgi:hypothetical protein